jgi:uncharacterized protein YqjF (DUF2071 family)
MTWHDLLFAHWSVPEDALRVHIPRQLKIDTHEGQAWLGIVPFGMRSTRLRCMPRLSGYPPFPELNVRTYVVAGDKPGVWFFSLDAGSRLAVRGARTFFHLNYYDARMRLEVGADGWTSYYSHRTHRGAPPADFLARYRATGEPYVAVPGGLESWLTDRYCLYSADRSGRVFRGEVHHPPWPLQPAEAQWEQNTMTAQLGFQLPHTPPLLHFAKRIDVVGWMLERVY